MRHRKIINALYGTPEERKAWLKRLDDERRRTQEAVDAYKRKENLRRQPVLTLDVPPIVLCPSCLGRGCKECKQQGVVQGEVKKISDPCMLEGQPSVSRSVECRRCWGVGQLASTRFLVKTCPDCEGTGRVEAPSD